MYNVEEQFRSACKQICEEFSFNYDKVQFSQPLSPGSVGQIYKCTMNKKDFEVVFTIETFESGLNVNDDKMYATLAIWPMSISTPFVFNFHGSNLGFIYGSLSHWLTCTIYDYNIKNHPFNFKLHFYDALIKIYGIPGYSTPTNDQLFIVLTGLNKIGKKITVYRFRHINEQKSISHSYSVRINSRLWLFFPDAAGGCEETDFVFIENMLSELPKNKLNRKYWDMPYEELEKYIGEKEAKFEYPIEMEKKIEVLQPPIPNPSLFGNNFVINYKKFRDELKNEDYAQMLRHLRALLQEAMEIICNKKKIDLKHIKNLSINKISESMLKEKIIDDKLNSWFLAFSSVANTSSHKLYPGPQELEKRNIQNRTLIALSLGMHLIYELEWIFYSKLKITTDGDTLEYYGLNESE